MAIRRSSARWAVVASAIGVLYIAWAAYEILSYGDHQGDFPTFYFVPKAAFEDGVSIYDSLEFRARAASAGISRVCPWLYPPHKALLLRPLSWIDYETSRRALYGVNIALALTLPYVLFARLRLHGRHRRLAAFAAAALPFFSPLHGNLYHGNLSLIALVFVLLAWDAGVRGRRAEGLWLAMATLMKLYPAALAAGLLLRRAWKPAAVMVVTLASFEAAALASLPASEWRVFMTEVAPMGGYGETPGGVIAPGAALNQGIGAVVARALISQGAYVAPIHAPWAVKPLALALSLLTIATAIGAAIVGRARFGGFPDRASREYAALLPAMFLVAPIAWASFALVLIPALIHAAKVRLDGEETFPWSIALAALLIALPVDPVAMSAVFGVQATMWACSTTFLGVAILFACTTRDLLRC